MYTESTEFLESEVSFPAQSLHPSITPISSFLIQEQQPIFTSATNNTPHTYDLQPQEPSSKTSSTNHSSPLRRTTGTVKPLSWLKDFACSPSASTPKSRSSNILYPLLQQSDLNHLHPEYGTSLCNVIFLREPHTYAQARQDPRWVDAMDQEIATLETNDI